MRSGNATDKKKRRGGREGVAGARLVLPRGLAWLSVALTPDRDMGNPSIVILRFNVSLKNFNVAHLIGATFVMCFINFQIYRFSD